MKSSSAAILLLLLAFFLSATAHSAEAPTSSPLLSNICESAEDDDKAYCRHFMNDNPECSDIKCLMQKSISDADNAASLCLVIGSETLKTTKYIRATKKCIRHFESVEEIIKGADTLVKDEKYDLIAEKYELIYHHTEKCVVAYGAGTNPFNLGMRKVLKSLDVGTVIMEYKKTH